MRIWSVLFVVLLLISVQAVQPVNNSMDTTGKAFSFEKSGKDVEIVSSLSRSGIYATLSQKLNKKDDITSTSYYAPITRELPTSQIDKKEEFICVAIIHLFPKKFQSNYLS